MLQKEKKKKKQKQMVKSTGNQIIFNGANKLFHFIDLCKICVSAEILTQTPTKQSTHSKWTKNDTNECKANWSSISIKCHCINV